MKYNFIIVFLFISIISIAQKRPIAINFGAHINQSLATKKSDSLSSSSGFGSEIAFSRSCLKNTDIAFGIKWQRILLTNQSTTKDIVKDFLGITASAYYWPKNYINTYFKYGFNINNVVNSYILSINGNSNSGKIKEEISKSNQFYSNFNLGIGFKLNEHTHFDIGFETPYFFNGSTTIYKGKPAIINLSIFYKIGLEKKNKIQVDHKYSNLANSTILIVKSTAVKDSLLNAVFNQVFNFCKFQFIDESEINTNMNTNPNLLFLKFGNNVYNLSKPAMMSMIIYNNNMALFPETEPIVLKYWGNAQFTSAPEVYRLVKALQSQLIELVEN